MKATFLFLSIFVFQTSSLFAANQFPHLTMEYSYGVDTYCPEKVDPEVLPDWITKLIPKVPVYRTELLQKVPYFQEEWNKVESHFLGTTVSEIGIPFQRKEFSVFLFLCPRFPSMGTPLMINSISYLETPIPDIPTLEKPMPIFLFNSIVFHEVLHKYVNDILKDHDSEILRRLPVEFLADMPNPELVKVHLHLLQSASWFMKNSISVTC